MSILGEIHVFSQILQNFGGDVYLCKLGKEYLNASICKFVIYFYIILKLSTYHTSFYH